MLVPTGILKFRTSPNISKESSGRAAKKQTGCVTGILGETYPTINRGGIDIYESSQMSVSK